MEPNGPIQIQPVGLLGLLQLKTLGRQPNDLGDAVIPQLDILGFYLRARQESGPTARLGLPPLVEGWAALPPLTVPAGEWWFVHQYSPTVLFTNNNVQATMASAIRPWGRGASAKMGAPQYFQGPGTGLAGTICVLPAITDFWLPPNSELGLIVDGLGTGSGGANDIYAALQFTRLPI